MSEQDTIAVIGAGVIGAAVALSLAREGRRVLLLDRAEPGVAGASFGNVGHIAAELVQPLPSPALLFGFWRELFCFGGALDLPARQALRMLPWIRRFAAAAFQRTANTRQLSPLVLPAAAAWARWLQEIAMPELLRRHGHYEIGFGPKSQSQMRANARKMGELGVKTRELCAAELMPLQQAANAKIAAGLWFEESAHLIDPLQAVRALVAAAKVVDEHLFHGFVVCHEDVADGAAADEMANLFSEILGMITGAFERLGHENDLQAGLAGYIFRILDVAEEDQIAEAIHFGIGADNVDCFAYVAVGEGVADIGQHFFEDGGHAGQVAGVLGINAAGGGLSAVGEAEQQVADALEADHELHTGQQFASFGFSDVGDGHGDARVNFHVQLVEFFFALANGIQEGR